MRADLAVVGAGPAGLATAIYARLAGLSVTVFDKRGLPLDKPCGEGLMPPGVQALAEMGVSLLPASRMPFEGICYRDEAAVAQADFVSGPGWGVRRTVLAAALLSRARELGVQVRLETKVDGWSQNNQAVFVSTAEGRQLEARTLVGADGLHSEVRRAAGLQARPRRPHRFGARCHFAVPPWSTRVEVHWVPGAEAYVTPVDPCTVGVALLWTHQSGGFDELLARFPALLDRLSGVERTSMIQGAGPFHQAVRRRYAGRVVLVGDAAGFVDPLTGEGLTLGLRSARALACTLAAGQPLCAYERAYTKLSRNYYPLTRLLVRVAARPRLRRRMNSMLAARPELLTRGLALLAEDQAPPLGLADAWRVLRGLGPLA